MLPQFKFASPLEKHIPQHPSRALLPLIIDLGIRGYFSPKRIGRLASQG